MLEETARRVVDGLRERGIDAHLDEEGVYEFAVRVPLGDGREAVWGGEHAAGLAAEVLADGDLVGFLPEIPGSEQFSVAQIVDAISRADYAQPEVHETPEATPSLPPLPKEGGLFRRLRDGFRYRD